MNVNASEHEKTLASMLTGLTAFVSNLLGAYEQQLQALAKENKELKEKLPKEGKSK